MLALRKSAGVLSEISLRLHQKISVHGKSRMRFHGIRAQGIRVGNTEIPDHKRLEVSLQHICGIGKARARQILCELSIANKLTKDLTGREISSLREEVFKYLIGEDLRRQVKHDIGRLVDIQCYKGIRHTQGLPCRGQRTHTNARTRRGKGPIKGL